ncbi:MAG: APC family permease, partial [Enterobacteriaceae bacterium]|nr:APC family permease [Enterobacteriaceae bacterium]
RSWALFVLWAYWMESIIWFPTVLIFIVAMLAHVLSPFYQNLDSNNLFLISGIVIVFWLLTFINFYGIRFSAMISSVGVFIGTVIPLVLIIFFGIFWLFTGESLSIDFNFKSLFPEFSISNMVFFSVVLLGISGIEVVSFHINDMDKPEVNFVKVLLISSVFILIVYVLGSLSIAMVVQKSEICLASGIIQALKVFFLKINIPFIIPFLALLLLIGSLSGMNTWIIAPARGLLVAAEDGMLPHFMRYVNKNDVPVVLLIVQAVIGSALSVFFFIYINSVNGLIWIFVCLSFQFASFLYIMIFFTVIKLRKKYPDTYRPYRVPFLKFTATLGIASCVFAFFVSYVQPSHIDVSEKNFYFLLLLLIFTSLMIPSLIFIFFDKIKKRQ